MQDNKNFLAAEPIGKLLLKLSIPTVIAQLINMLYNIVDRIYIGHIPSDGSLALTGVGVCMPIIMIVTAFTLIMEVKCPAFLFAICCEERGIQIQDHGLRHHGRGGHCQGPAGSVGF